MVWFLETFCLTRNSNESRGPVEVRKPLWAVEALELSLLLLVGFGVFSMLAAHWNILRCFEHTIEAIPCTSAIVLDLVDLGGRNMDI